MAPFVRQAGGAIKLAPVLAISGGSGSNVMQVNILEAKNRLSELVRAVQAGEEVVIANRGRPVVRLVPAEADAPRPSQRGSAAAILGWLKDHPLPPYPGHIAEEIDAAIEADRNAWD